MGRIIGYVRRFFRYCGFDGGPASRQSGENVVVALKVLIDRNLEQLAVRAEGATKTETIQWGPHNISSEIHGYRGKPMPQGDWLALQLRALPTIARLAKEGKLIFCTSQELGFESFQAARGYQGFVGDIFRDISFKDVPPAIDRSYFSQSGDLGEYTSGEAQAKWCKEFLLKVSDERKLLKALERYDALPEFNRQNIANLSRFRELCANLTTSDHHRDAFHLWTAEVNGLDYFVTADKRFINVMTKSKRVDLPTPPISPAELLERLGVRELDPLPLDDRRFRNLFDE